MASEQRYWEEEARQQAGRDAQETSAPGPEPEQFEEWEALQDHADATGDDRPNEE